MSSESGARRTLEALGEASAVELVSVVHRVEVLLVTSSTSLTFVSDLLWFR